MKQSLTPKLSLYIPGNRTVRKVRCVNFSSEFAVDYVDDEDDVRRALTTVIPEESSNVDKSEIKSSVEAQVTQTSGENEINRYPKRSNRGVMPKKYDDYVAH